MSTRYVTASLSLFALLALLPACVEDEEVFDERSAALESVEDFEYAPTDNAAECTNLALWSENYCSAGCPCDPLEGDCDSDLECGAGLDCSMNVGASFGVASSVDVCQAPCMNEPSQIRAWWPGDSNAQDQVGSAHGTLTSGASISTGFSSKGFVLNGSGYMQAADNSALDFGTGDMSLAMWVKTTDTNGVKVLVDKRKEISNDVQGYVAYVYNGKLGFQLADGTGSSTCSSSASASCTNYDSGRFVADGAWHFLVVSVDRDSTTGLRFYVDGDLVKSSNPTVRPGSLSNSRPLRIGARSESGTGKLLGSVDEVMLFSRSLTAWEVAGIHETGTNGLCRAVCVPSFCSPGMCGVYDNGCGGIIKCFDCDCTDPLVPCLELQ
ncbi:MAG: LamG domain-containing protein [Myxococcales bacterium]|nr:LamG domain-containing protein [Myxococcales bacterium]